MSKVNGIIGTHRASLIIHVYEPGSRKLPANVLKAYVVVLLVSVLISVTFFCYLPVSQVFSQPADERPQEQSLITDGQPIERKLSPGRTHVFLFEPGPQQYLHVAIETHGFDIQASISDPDGRPLMTRDNFFNSATTLSLIIQRSGTYRLTVQAHRQEVDAGSYVLRAAIRQSEAADVHRLAAEQAFAEAETLLQDWQAASTNKAIAYFQQSLLSWQAISDARGEGLALKRLGDVYQLLGQNDFALKYYEQARSVWRQLGDRGEEADTLNELAYVYLNQGKNKIAEQLCLDALAAATAARRGSSRARALNNLGEVSYGFGKLQESLTYYKRALPLWQEAGQRNGEALTLLNFGYTCSDVGQMREAIDYYDQALAIWTRSRNRRGQGITLTAIGRLYSRMGESQKALAQFEHARPIIEDLSAPADLGRVFTGIAYVYDQLSEHQKALDYYNRALPLFRSTGDYSGEAVTIYDAARSLAALGRQGEALQYLEKALVISSSANDRRLQAFESREIGKVYAALKQPEKALNFLLRAAGFWKIEHDNRAEAETLNPIGRIHQERGETAQARAAYTRATALCRQAEYPVGEAVSLYNLAELERDQGRLNEARQTNEAGIAVVESLRTKVVSGDLRASYLASVRQHYELYIDVLMLLHQQHPAEGLDKKAFEISEKARARSLLELLEEARSDIREGVDRNLLERERLLEQTINAKAERHAQLVANPAASSEANEVAKEIDQLTTEYQELETQIKLTSPRYAALTQPAPLSLVEVQNQLLDDRTLLLEYALGNDRSYLWVVKRSEWQAFELPGRRVIEERAQSFSKLLTANQPIAGESFAERQARIQNSNTGLLREAADLSRLVLGPAAEKLTAKRLLIVPDGALQYIPFQALLVPATTKLDTSASQRAASAGNEMVSLIMDHEIVNEPSASALALVLRESTGRVPAPNSVAVLANPVFEADDPRVKSQGAGQSAGPASPGLAREVFRDAGISEGLRIPALPASREEAAAIMSVVPWRTGWIAEGFDANRAAVEQPELGQYRIIHFATHGIVNYQHPELSGLVLSLVDEQGKPQDGFLRMHDIYNLKLPVDLVVLSACNTALGKEVKGEGLMGLTRAFMYAGASSVVASLWKVDDEATAELMKHFYEGMYQRNLTPAAALREAQLTMRQRKRWQAPYYWAGFVIQGNYSASPRSAFALTPAVKLILAVTIVILFVAVSTLIIIKRHRRLTVVAK